MAWKYECNLLCLFQCHPSYKGKQDQLLVYEFMDGKVSVKQTENLGNWDMEVTCLVVTYFMKRHFLFPFFII